MNENVWGEDSGILIDRLIFFVFEFRFGDIWDRGEKGYYIFWKLKCYNVKFM